MHQTESEEFPTLLVSLGAVIAFGISDCSIDECLIGQRDGVG
jgi:hypothetical protein